MNQKIKINLIKAIKIIVVLAIIFFIVRLFINNITSLREIDFRFDILKFITAVILFAVYKINSSLLWHYITKKNDCSIPLNKAIISWFYSLLGKFIPGKIFLLGGRLYFYSKEGVSKKNVLSSFLIENICTILGGALLFLFSMLFVNNQVLQQYRYPVIILISIFFIIIHPFILEKAINIPLKLLKKKPVVLKIKYVDMLKLVLIYSINFFIVGIGFFMLVISIYQIEFKNIFYVSGTFGLAAVIGIISLFAPSGIGVREGIIILALKFVIPEAAAIVVSIVSRLWSTVTELSLVAIVFIYGKIRKIEFKSDQDIKSLKENKNSKDI